MCNGGTWRRGLGGRVQHRSPRSPRNRGAQSRRGGRHESPRRPHARRAAPTRCPETAQLSSFLGAATAQMIITQKPAMAIIIAVHAQPQLSLHSIFAHLQEPSISLGPRRHAVERQEARQGMPKVPSCPCRPPLAPETQPPSRPLHAPGEHPAPVRRDRPPDRHRCLRQHDQQPPTRRTKLRLPSRRIPLISSHHRPPTDRDLVNAPALQQIADQRPLRDPPGRFVGLGSSTLACPASRAGPAASSSASACANSLTPPRWA
jgi:hypothetical protein